jgi:hypothetical protein
LLGVKRHDFGLLEGCLISTATKRDSLKTGNLPQLATFDWLSTDFSGLGRRRRLGVIYSLIVTIPANPGTDQLTIISPYSNPAHKSNRLSRIGR